MRRCMECSLNVLGQCRCPYLNLIGLCRFDTRGNLVCKTASFDPLKVKR